MLRINKFSNYLLPGGEVKVEFLGRGGHFQAGKLMVAFGELGFGDKILKLYGRNRL